VICTFTVFILFYNESPDGFSAQSVLLHSIKRYHTNRNIADLVDYIQEQLECCGSTSTAQGFRDWQFSEQFNCSPSNPYPERCGVPFSCCRRAVVSEAAGSSNPLAPAIRSLQCWQNAQRKAEQELDNDIYTSGCLQQLRFLFDRHAVHMGMAVVAIIVPVCFGVFLSQCLARQIDYQHYLLKREQRRFKRQEQRERKYLEATPEQQQQQHKNSNKKRRSTSAGPGDGTAAEGTVGNGGEHRQKRRTPPNIPPPPTPPEESPEEAMALAKAIAASKREFESDQRRQARQRAVSASPLRPIIAAPNSALAARGSRTLEASAAAQQQLRNKQKNEVKRPHKGGGGDHQVIKHQEHLDQHKKSSKKATTKQHQGSLAQRPQPSAPPAQTHYILQQSHFS